MATSPTDLRKSFDGLSALVQAELGMSPLRGDMFVFLNRRATQVRILFRVRSADGEASVEIEAAELAMLLQGIDAEAVHKRKRYKPPADPQIST